ncbi:MAG TPA: hypothetical protein VEC08_05290 [Nitrososphaerales archaeon]|nr:hypothetical protein [Nitrososphaerales archaeon]
MKSVETALELDFLLGLAGLFGIGEAYLGSWMRAAGFLVMSGALYASVLSAFAEPSLAFVWGYLPAAFGLGNCLQAFDIFQLTDQAEAEPGR